MIDTSIDPEIYRSATGDLVGVVLLAIVLFAAFLAYRRKGTGRGEGLGTGERRPAETGQAPREAPEPQKADEEIRKAA